MSENPSASAFELQFLLWAVRHRIKGDGSDHVMGMELAATFSRSGATLAAESIDRLTRVLARHDRDLAPVGAAYSTHLEDILLGAYASGRRGEAENARRLITGLAGRDAERRRSLSEGLKGIADLFRRQPPSDHFQRLAAFRDTIHGESVPVWLSPGLDLMIVFAMRVWVAAHKSGVPALRTIQSCLAEGPEHVDWRALDAILHNASKGARRPIEINCLCYQVLSDDEQSFLGALGAMRQGGIGAAIDILWQWQQPAAARLSISALEIFAGSLGLDGANGEGRAGHMSSSGSAPCTLH